jgi:protein gp37
MAKNSAISWTNDSWNPWQGCLKVSQGCAQCYMYRDKARYGQDPQVVVRSKPATFNSPLTKLDGPLIFTCSWSDFFIEQADDWRDEAWAIIRKTARVFVRKGKPHAPLTYQILTKRPENIADRLPPDWGYNFNNVWLGVSVEDNDNLWRIDELAKIPHIGVKFVSYEPALEYVNFKPYAHLFDWLISGGESGPGYRPAEPFWFEQVSKDMADMGVCFFHKQHGGNRKVEGDWGGNKIKGKLMQDFPVPTV